MSDPFLVQLTRLLSDEQLEHRVKAIRRRARRGGRLSQSEYDALAAMLDEQRRRRMLQPVKVSRTERIRPGRDPKPVSEVPNHGHPTSVGGAA